MSDVIRLTNELKEYIEKARTIKKKRYNDLLKNAPDLKYLMSDDFSDSRIILIALQTYVDVMYNGDYIDE